MGTKEGLVGRELGHDMRLGLDRNTNGGLQNGYEKVLFIPFCCLLGVTVTTEKEKTASVGTTGIHVTLDP